MVAVWHVRELVAAIKSLVRDYRITVQLELDPAPQRAEPRAAPAHTLTPLRVMAAELARPGRQTCYSRLCVIARRLRLDDRRLDYEAGSFNLPGFLWDSENLFERASRRLLIDAARLLTYRSAAMKNAGKPTTKESSMAKLFASEISVNVCEEAIQVHGGYGYTKDYPPEKYWRDSKLCTIGEGTSEIQRIIIAREVLKQV